MLLQNLPQTRRRNLSSRGCAKSRLLSQRRSRPFRDPVGPRLALRSTTHPDRDQFGRLSGPRTVTGNLGGSASTTPIPCSGRLLLSSRSHVKPLLSSGACRLPSPSPGTGPIPATSLDPPPPSNRAHK
ncbi:hypothetical protein MC885_000292 [Smutsia gigantea]|nr:hypothetical protein MC885_000292 [Smutsia gigantea]